MSGMDVVAWNAENPEHPRSGDGRFSVVGVIIEKLQEAFGDVLHHAEVGAEDHPFSDRGVVAVHSGGKLSISKIDEDGEHSTVTVLDHSAAGVIAENVEDAVRSLQDNDYEPGSHFDFAPDEPDDRPVVSFGVMADGRQYVSIDTDDDGLQLDIEHAEEFAAQMDEASSEAFQAANNPDNPHATRPLPGGQTLERRKVIKTEGDNNVIGGLVATPDGVRMRLGVGDTEEHPAKKWTGGRGPMVADLGPDEARELDETIGQVLDELDDYHTRLEEVDAIQSEWYEQTPSGQRLRELSEQGWAMWSSVDGDIVQRPTGGRTQWGTQEKELAPPDIDAEYRRLRAELGAAVDDIDLVDEGEAFGSWDVETPWGTIQIDAIGNSTAHEDPVQARITVRPKGVSAEEWEDQWDVYSRASDLPPAKLKQLRKLVAGYLETTAALAPMAKSAGAVVDTPGAGRARALKRYWTRGKGLKDWIRSAHPWSTLRRHLAEYIYDPDKLDATTSAWFHAATGMWSGERKGRNPVGRG